MAKRAKNQRRVKTETAYVGGKRVAVDKQKALMGYLMQRVGVQNIERQARLTRYDAILRGLAAKTEEKGLSKAKRLAYAKGETEVIPEMRYPAALGELNDIAANVTNVLFPARQMYGSVELTPEKQKEATALVAEMNKHGKSFKHYLNFYKTIHNAIAFNEGVAEIEWKEVRAHFGESRPSREDVTIQTTLKTVRRGNKIKHLDIFNTILDYTVATEDYASEAEFYATVELLTDFDLLRMASRKQVILQEETKRNLRKMRVENGQIKLANAGLSKFYQSYSNELGLSGAANGASNASGLYRKRSDFRTHIESLISQHAEDCANNRYNLSEDMGLGVASLQEKPGAANELLTITIRLDASAFGLGSVASSNAADASHSDMQIWRFRILNGEEIVYAAPAGQAHGLLPVAVTRPKSELSDTNSLSLSELLLPFQEASSSLLNMFLAQVRSDKNKGITFYNKDAIDLDSMADPTTGYVGASPTNNPGDPNRAMRDLIHNVQGHPVNSNVLAADQAIAQKKETVFPTNSVDQLANLNRPVTHQSRQITQLQNLPIFVLARVIHDELVEPINYMQSREIIASGMPLQILNEAGEEEEIPSEALNNADLSYAVSDGLRGIDTIALADRMATLVQQMLQTPENLREFDLAKLQTFLMNLEGVNIDFANFRYKDPFDALPPEQKQAAMQLLQEAMAQNEQQEASPTT